MSPRRGRPTDCLKDHDIKVRIDSDTHTKLMEYCENHGMTKAEAIRQGIRMVLEQKKKQRLESLATSTATHRITRKDFSCEIYHITGETSFQGEKRDILTQILAKKEL